MGISSHTAQSLGCAEVIPSLLRNIAVSGIRDAICANRWLADGCNRKFSGLSNSAELDEAEEKPIKGVHPNKVVISQCIEPQ